jgi:hypothetical protein
VSAAAAGPAGATPAAPNPLADCNSTGRLTHQYSTAVLQHALATMPADLREYSDCYDVIQRALLAQVSTHRDGPGGPGGSGGSFLPIPVIVVIALLGLAAATFGVLALRRHAGGGGAEAP